MKVSAVISIKNRTKLFKRTLKLLNKQMILQCLSDVSCLEEYTAAEILELEGMLTLKSNL